MTLYEISILFVSLFILFLILSCIASAKNSKLTYVTSFLATICLLIFGIVGMTSHDERAGQLKLVREESLIELHIDEVLNIEERKSLEGPVYTIELFNGKKLNYIFEKDNPVLIGVMTPTQ